MSIAQQRIGAAEARPRAWPNPVRFPAKALFGAASMIGRVLVGSGPATGIRGYGSREGYPEHELHQIVAGRKDRFDGLM
jgi:hypothetical protein